MVLTMKKLKGENRIEEFRQTAKNLASKIASYEGVVGIVFIGGLVRGFVDKFSDLDITVFIDRKDEELKGCIYNVGLGEGKASGIDLDLEIHFIEDFKRCRLNEADRWEFSRAKIFFDPKGEVEHMFREKLRVSESFWIKRIVVCGEYLKWYCCPPKEGARAIQS